MSANPPQDIEVLMERIRNEVSRRRNTPAPQSAPETSRLYSLGTLLKFGLNDNASAHTGAGWSYAEPGFRWTDGADAEMMFVFENVPGDLVLSFTVHPLLGGEVNAQEVTASWNGVAVGEWTIREAKSYHTIILSHGSSTSKSGLLKFHLPLSFSPLAKNLGGDPRQLGLAFHELVLRPAVALGF